MKWRLFLCLLVVAAFAQAGEKPNPAGAVKGEILEVQDIESYTYLRLKTRDGETWAVVSRAPLKKGGQVTIEDVTVMKNFESRLLKRKFDTILMGTVAGASGRSGGMAAPHAGINGDVPDVRVPKATGANARTVAEIVTRSAELKDKQVRVRGRVVKYNAGIMGKNWIHLRDGSGSAADNTHDLLVTTTEQAAPGDVLTVDGVVRTDKDFGAGYAYKVMIEEARLQR